MQEADSLGILDQAVAADASVYENALKKVEEEVKKAPK